MTQRTEIPGPDWLGPHLDDLLDSGPGNIGHGRVDAITLRNDDTPSSIVSASYAGLVYVDFSTDSRDRETIDISFYPWRSVERVRIYGDLVQLTTAGEKGNRPAPSTRFYDREEPEKAEAEAREFGASLIRLMRGSR